MNRADFETRTSPSAGRRGAGYLAIGGMGLLGLIGLATLSGGFYTIDERERGVVTNNGALSHIAGPGFHLKVPFRDSVEEISIGVRSLELKKLETFTTGEQPQHVDMDWVVQWAIPAASVERVFRLGSSPEVLLRTMVANLAKIEVGRRHANAIPTERGAIVTDVFTRVKAEAERLYGIQIVDLQLTNFDYSPAFRQAVDAAAVALQRQAQVQADAVSATQKAAGEANAAIEAARGRASSALTEARALAEATALQGRALADNIALQGEAQARGLRAQAEALGANPQLVALEAARRWNGSLPTQMVPGSAVPFIDLNRTAAR